MRSRLTPTMLKNENARRIHRGVAQSPHWLLPAGNKSMFLNSCLTALPMSFARVKIRFAVAAFPRQRSFWPDQLWGERSGCLIPSFLERVPAPTGIAQIAVSRVSDTRIVLREGGNIRTSTVIACVRPSQLNHDVYLL